MTLAELTLRRSSARDLTALARLAELDSAAPPVGDYLLAEEDGRLRAALPLDGGPVIADPFHRTSDLVAALELRAARLLATTKAAKPRRRLGALLRRGHRAGRSRDSDHPSGATPQGSAVSAGYARARAAS